MKWWIPVFAVLTMAASDKPAGKSAPQQPAAARAKSQPAPVTLPAGAVQVAPGSYAYTDSQGKHWLYRQTPFGWARLDEKAVSKDESSSAAKRSDAEQDPINAVDDGDYVRFSRPGPFGTYNWRRKKTDLDEIEKSAWDRTRNKADSSKGSQE